MSPFLAWIGVVLGMLVAVPTGLQVGIGAHPERTSSVFGAQGVRQPGSTADDGPTCSPGWGMPDTSYYRSILASVVASGDAAWAVGLTTDTEDPRYPLAVRWDGSAWADMPIAPSSAERALFGLDRSPTGRMWAAGYRARSSLYYPLMMRWDGTRWDVSPLGTLGARGGALLSVRAAHDSVTWSVGYKVGESGQRPLAIRRLDGRWTDSSPSVPSSATGVLLDIDARNYNDAWAVGWLADSGAPQPYLAHWDGRHWASGVSAATGSEGVLTSVAIAGTKDVWAVGYRAAHGGYRPMVQHWDGRRWSMSEFPSVHAEVAILRAVQIGSDRQPVVVGTRWDAAGGTWRGFAASRHDTGWSVTDVPPMSGHTELRDLVTHRDGTAWVVGANGTKSLAISVCPGPVATPGGTTVGPTPGPSQLPGASDSPVVEPGPSPDPGASASAQSSPQPASVTAVASADPGASARPTRSASPTSAPVRSPRPTRAPRPTPTPPVIVRDVTSAVGLTLDTASYGAVRADFNGDGWPDLFIGRHSNPGWMVLNDQAGFVDAPGTDFPKRDRHGCSAGDANGDGRVDLYCANGAFHGAGFKANELYIQQPDGTFRDEALAMHATDPFGRGRLVAMLDLDHDQYADLFLADRPARTDGLPSVDRVLANPDGTGYVGRSVAGFDAAGGADCLRAADLDGDGWQDILLCQRAMDRTNAYGVLILHNVKGHLVDVTRTTGIAKRQTVDAIAVDMDGDHHLDIVEVTPYQLRIHLWRTGGHYVLGYTRPLSHGVAVAAGDVDGDGDPDLYVVQGSRTRQRPDLMLLNVGHGRSFRQLAIPGATHGSAESVTAIDYDRNGLTDFLVLNGRGAQFPGPVQLIAFFPRP